MFQDKIFSRTYLIEFWDTVLIFLFRTIWNLKVVQVPYVYNIEIYSTTKQMDEIT